MSRIPSRTSTVTDRRTWVRGREIVPGVAIVAATVVVAAGGPAEAVVDADAADGLGAEEAAGMADTGAVVGAVGIKPSPRLFTDSTARRLDPRLNGLGFARGADECVRPYVFWVGIVFV